MLLKAGIGDTNPQSMHNCSLSQRQPEPQWDDGVHSKKSRGSFPMPARSSDAALESIIYTLCRRIDLQRK